MSIIEQYPDHFLPSYNNYPQGRYTSLLILRKVESEAIFRTEGSGEPLNREHVFAGRSAGEIVPRVVISKRKQTAVERRTGRELLRQLDLLFPAGKDGAVCTLNTNNPCGHCMDCMVYGYAAGGGGAQKSRVVTDDAFSLHQAGDVIDTRQFNALFDNSTMRNPETGEPSTSIGTDEYVRPETLFLEIETLRDLTAEEFYYVVGNILRSTRYGAISSRIGKLTNTLVGVVLSDVELFSNLELTQHVYDQLRGDDDQLEFPLHLDTVVGAMRATTETLLATTPGRAVNLEESDVDALVAEVQALYQDRTKIAALLEKASHAYPAPKK